MDRRTFLRLSALTTGGLVAGSSALAACGSSAAKTSGNFLVVSRFPPKVLTPGAVRLPVSLADPGGTLVTGGPAALKGTYSTIAGKQLGTFVADRHGKDIANPYWPITVQIPEPGLYNLTIEGVKDPTPFQVFDPADVAPPSIGAALRPFDTPTTADAKGVNPVCTLTPNPCPFHAVSLADALEAGTSVAYFIGTPAHCQTGVCAPSLQFLIEAATAYTGKVTFVHAEVYTDNTATTTAPAVDAYQLDYEPVLYLADATGKVVDRMDVMWDLPEIQTRLKAVYG